MKNIFIQMKVIMRYKVILASFLILLIFSYTHVQAKKSLLCKTAPQFIGQAVYPDGSIKALDLNDYFGQNLVLYFYPMDNSPHCTIQAKKFRDEIGKLQAQNITVIGVSGDSINSHKKFQAQLALPFPLVSDSDKKNRIARKYNATGFLFGKRKTFLINKQGIVFKEFEQVDIKNQITDILESFENESSI